MPLVLATEDLARIPLDQIPFISNLVRSRQGSFRTPDGNIGELLAPPIKPYMAYQWIGLELLPGETGIAIALERDGVYFQFLQGIWQPAVGPNFYSPHQVRQWIRQWAGPLQLRFRLTPEAALSGVKVGFEVALDYLAYMAEFVLPKALSFPTQLSLWAEPSSDGSALPLPPVVPSRISNPIAFCPSQSIRVSGTVGADAIYLERPIPVATTQLIFDYAPLVEFTAGVYQFSEMPVVTLRLGEEKSRSRINIRDWVKMSEDTAAIWSAGFQYDQEISVGVVGRSLADVNAIAQRIIAEVEKNGMIPVPAFGLHQIISVSRGIQKGTPVQGEDNLFSVSLELTLHKLIDSDSASEAELVQVVAPEPTPQ